jgi:hypothetical protein
VKRWGGEVGKKTSATISRSNAISLVTRLSKSVARLHWPSGNGRALGRYSSHRASGYAGSSRRSSDQASRPRDQADRTNDRQGSDAPPRTAVARSGCPFSSQ